MAARFVPEDELGRFFKIYPDILGILDFEGRLRRVNSIWETVLGYSQQELTTLPILELSHPDDRAQFTSALQRLLNEEEIVTFEARLQTKRGKYKRFLFNTTATVPTRTIYAAGRDLSGEVRFPEVRYWRLFETSMDGMLIMDAVSMLVLDIN